jgi:predicted nucleotidyltransferase
MPITQSQIDKIVRIAQIYGATRLILFGSSLERTQTARDIDLACDGVPGWKIYELAARIEEELECPLDVIPLSPPTSFTRHIEKKGKVLL